MGEAEAREQTEGKFKCLPDQTDWTFAEQCIHLHVGGFPPPMVRVRNRAAAKLQPVVQWNAGPANRADCCWFYFREDFR